jgi:phage terminase small subunit
MASRPLNAKQQRFVDEYLIDLNATQAAIRAGYSGKTAEQIGYQLLQRTSVAEAVAAGKAALAEKSGVTVERIVAELSKLGFSNMDNFVRRTSEGDIYTDFSEVTHEQMAAVGEVTVETYKEGRGDDAKDVKRVKFKLADKRAALVDLGKHLGMFVDRSEVKSEVVLTDMIDRPPNETREQWLERRQKELGRALGSAAGTAG